MAFYYHWKATTSKSCCATCGIFHVENDDEVESTVEAAARCPFRRSKLAKMIHLYEKHFDVIEPAFERPENNEGRLSATFRTLGTLEDAHQYEKRGFSDLVTLCAVFDDAQYEIGPGVIPITSLHLLID